MYFSKRTVSLTLSLSFLVAGPKSYDVVSDDLKNRIFEITRATGSIIVDADLDDVGWADAASTDFFLDCVDFTIRKNKCFVGLWAALVFARKK